MRKVTIVFPMAGEGQRFGNKFKPFLKIFDKCFIELAIEPFIKHKDKIEKFIFIVRKDHSKQFNVSNKFLKFDIPILFFISEIEPTNNVIETISTLFEFGSLKDVIFCDCDHSLNVDAIFETIDENKYDCIIPGWPILPDESKIWSIASVDNDNTVKSIKEKEYPKKFEKYFGVIGCYYFKQIDKPNKDFKYLSEVINSMIQHKKIKLVEIKEAEFFGDPQRLENLYINKKACSIFCDLDGTIIKHENIPDYSRIELLNGAKEKIEEWRNNHAFIVLTTSRDEQFRPEMETMLREVGIRYEYLVMGLPPGPRYLINDKKPYSNVEMAKSFEVIRDLGIKGINIGHSSAEFNIKNKTIYKSISKNSTQYQLDKFRSQYESMLKIRNLPGCGDLIPAVSDFSSTRYAIEYLEGYNGLHLFSCEDRMIILNKLFNELSVLYDNKVYCPLNWLNEHLHEKIYLKNNVLNKLNLDSKIINNIKQIVDKKYDILSPRNLSMFYHGDLTYENILSENGNIKLIDFDNDNLPGCVELDLGKLMQSVLTKYEYWDDLSNEEIVDIDHNYNKSEYDMIVNFYSVYLQQSVEQIKAKAYFYCALHLFRMIPYQAKTSMRRANIALSLSKKCLQLID